MRFLSKPSKLFSDSLSFLFYIPAIKSISSEALSSSDIIFFYFYSFFIWGFTFFLISLTTFLDLFLGEDSESVIISSLSSDTIFIYFAFNSFFIWVFTFFFVSLTSFLELFLDAEFVTGS